LEAIQEEFLSGFNKDREKITQEINEEEMKRNVYLNKQCIECHPDVYKNLNSFTNQHLDIVPKFCAICHLNIMTKGTSEGTIHKIIGQRYGEEFLIPIGKLSDEGNICFKSKLINKNNELAESDFYSLVPSKVEAELIDDGTSPDISEVQITEFKLGVFDEAQVSWKTDKFSNSEVQYAKTGDNWKRIRDLNLVKNHGLNLEALAHDTEFNYKVVSKDIFGNTSISDKNTFSTTEDNIYKYNISINPLSPPTLEKAGALKIGKDVFLYVKADQEVKYLIDYQLQKSEGEESELASVLAHSKGLKTKKSLGIGSCRRCHGKQEVAEHPVDVRPSKKIPKDLPIADGVMTCVTCHNAHGGNNPHLLKKKEAKLCDSCHNIGG
jgi:predicted CXXCH cytochrome family protein